MASDIAVFMKLHSDAKIVLLFGGITTLATALGVDRRVVHNWTRRGISAAGRYQVRDLAKSKRITLPATFMSNADA